MEHMSQKIIYLGNLRNGQYFRPIYDSYDVSPIHLYQRMHSKNGIVTCWEEGSGFIIQLPAVFPVRRVIEAE